MVCKLCTAAQWLETSDPHPTFNNIEDFAFFG